jgi:hypothetical protein
MPTSFRGLLLNVWEGGIVNLQYVDDNILFLENNVELAVNLKWMLVCFEHLSWMRINYDKSDLVPIGLEEVEENCGLRYFVVKKKLPY